MRFLHTFLFKFHRYLINNKVVVKIYAIFPWRDILYTIKRILFLDKEMTKNSNIFTIKNINVRFFLPYYKKDFIQKQIIQNKNFYEIDFLNHVCTLNNNIVEKKINSGFILDIGANIGNHTIYFLKNKHAKKVFCFEPVKDTFDILKKNIEINELHAKVQLFNTGVGEKSGNAILKHYNINNIGTAQLDFNESGDIPIISIDDLKINENVDFIKIDVEGFELNVVKGMIETLKQFKPLIMIEIRDFLFNDIDNILASIGYEHYTIDVDIYKIGNYLFVPREH